jgi:hypothetical protein
MRKCANHVQCSIRASRRLVAVDRCVGGGGVDMLGWSSRGYGKKGIGWNTLVG